MKSITVLLASLICFSAACAQDHYRVDFLTFFKQAPSASDLEAAYRFTACKDNSCKDFTSAKTVLESALKELGNLQAAASMSALPAAKPTMTPEEAKKMTEKLKSMSKEEKLKWAMENANSAMLTGRVNRDIDNPVVTDAVKYVSDEQSKEGFDLGAVTRTDSVFRTVDEKYRPGRDALLKTFQKESGIQYDPISSSPYIFGEASEKQVQKFERALAAYKKEIIPVLNSEMNEKTAWLSKQKQMLTERYRITEEKIATTHYFDDAKETVNRTQLILAHTKVLRNVIEIMGSYQKVLQEYSKLYTSILKIEDGKK